MVVGLNLTMELYDGGASRIDRQYKTLRSHALKKRSRTILLELNSKIEGAKANLFLIMNLFIKLKKLLVKLKHI